MPSSNIFQAVNVEYDTQEHSILKRFNLTVNIDTHLLWKAARMNILSY